MDLPTALAHLAAAGITPPVLVAEGVDPADSAALRGLRADLEDLYLPACERAA
jgi:hypothetical protein